MNRDIYYRGKRDFPSWQEQREYARWMRIYFLQWEWEWLAHLSIRPEIGIELAKQKFKLWRFKIIGDEKLRIAAIRITAWKKKQPHFHVLMHATNRFGKNLFSCNPDKYVNIWQNREIIKERESISKRSSRSSNRLGVGTAKIRVIDNQSMACGYGAAQFYPSKNEYAETEHYDFELLERSMKYPNPPYDLIGALSG